jgi:hypothetical protein
MRNETLRNIGYAPSVGGLAGWLSRLPGGELLNVSRSNRLPLALVALVWLGLAGPLMLGGSLAQTADLIERCEGLANKAYPSRVLGNPAAGRVHGTRQFLDYFNKCVKHRPSAARH